VFVDYILLILVATIGTSLTVVGGFVASEKNWVRIFFLVLGPILLVVVIWQGIRQINSQSTADSAYLNLDRTLRDERRLSDMKVDSLFALLQGKVIIPQPPKPRPKPDNKPPAKQAAQNLNTTDSVSWVKVSHEDRVSTRADAPFAQELIIQVSNQTSPVRAVITCNEEVIDGDAIGVGAIVNYRKGVMSSNPKVFVLAYQFPPLSPRQPLSIEIWTKQKATCQAQLF
jgi:hypothetical protein